MEHIKKQAQYLFLIPLHFILLSHLLLLKKSYTRSFYLTCCFSYQLKLLCLKLSSHNNRKNCFLWLFSQCWQPLTITSIHYKKESQFYTSDPPLIAHFSFLTFKASIFCRQFTNRKYNFQCSMLHKIYNSHIIFHFFFAAPWSLTVQTLKYLFPGNKFSLSFSLSLSFSSSEHILD